jgi:ankyrin repeat protein
MGTRKNNTFRRTRSKRQKGGAPKRARDNDTALILASLDGKTKKVEKLLNQKGIKVNARDDWGKTALHWASYYGHTETVAMLLKQKGIKVNANTIAGDTALDYAIEEEHTEIVKLLKKQIILDRRLEVGLPLAKKLPAGPRHEVLKYLDSGWGGYKRKSNKRKSNKRKSNKRKLLMLREFDQMSPFSHMKPP